MQNSTQAQDQTKDPGAVRQQSYPNKVKKQIERKNILASEMTEFIEYIESRIKENVILLTVRCMAVMIKPKKYQK